VTNRDTIAVIGLGYVGLPLAVEFGKIRSVIGFDINEQRIQQLIAGRDSTFEVDPGELLTAKNLRFTSNDKLLETARVFIVTVPTPVDAQKNPDLTALEAASRLVGEYLKPGDTVVYESTVYPGATEEVCVPLLQSTSGLRLNEDFYVGYSPERINPGDKTHRLPNITKVTSGSCPAALEAIDALYAEIITAGTFRATSIRVAEAAKVIENTQRDLNIALMNELSIIFSRMDIDTAAVLEAAGTKWNFLPFRPGLVGGHCIGVDPYYLTHKAEQLGYKPEVILAGRNMNDQMGTYAANLLVNKMIERGINIEGARSLVLGVTFKENCPDTRNTRVLDLVDGLRQRGLSVDIYDPLVVSDNELSKQGYSLIDSPMRNHYDAVVLATPHTEFVALGIDKLRAYGTEGHVFFDLKSIFQSEMSDIRL